MSNYYKTDTINSVETSCSHLSIEDGILFFNYKSIENLDLETAKACVRERLKFTGNNYYPCLADVTKLNNITREAREYFAEEGNDYLTANAILVSSPLLKMMANFFIKVNKPKNPTRMFTDKASALEWLQQFKSKASL